MIKLKEILTEAEVSRELWYHINNDISLEECVFRYGSPKYFTIINEARLLQCEQNIDFDNQTRALMNEGIEFDSKTKALLETDLGEFAMYEGEEVPLDFPMINEAIVDYDFSKEELIRVIKQLKRGASTEIGMIKAFEKALGRELTDDEIRGSKLDENKKKKKDPPIGKPKRGGSKAYYVYVRDPKTKRIKKVSFGSGGLRAKINNPKARNAFAKRHRCTTATDKTTARYWSCRLPRYAKQLGIAASNPGGFW